MWVLISLRILERLCIVYNIQSALLTVSEDIQLFGVRCSYIAVQSLSFLPRLKFGPS